MPRRPREDVPGALHHVVAKGSGGESIVRDEHDRKELLARLGRTVGRYRWSCLAYCIMDTHFHLLVGTPAANLGVGMQWLLASYARDFNKRHKRDGNLFHCRFYSKRVTSDEHLTSAIVYVALNPVRAGLVEQPEAWRWSSYAATVGIAAAPRFLDTRAVLELVDEHPRSAQLLLRVAVGETRAGDEARVGVRHGV